MFIQSVQRPVAVDIMEIWLPFWDRSHAQTDTDKSLNENRQFFWADSTSAMLVFLGELDPGQNLHTCFVFLKT